MKLSATVPAFMRELGWRLDFVSAGGPKFGMQPGATKEILFAMVEGEPIDKANLPESEKERTIEITAEAAGIPLGGMSYVIDPSYVDPNDEEPAWTGARAGQARRVRTRRHRASQVPEARPRGGRLRRGAQGVPRHHVQGRLLLGRGVQSSRQRAFAAPSAGKSTSSTAHPSNYTGGRLTPNRRCRVNSRQRLPGGGRIRAGSPGKVAAARNRRVRARRRPPLPGRDRRRAPARRALPGRRQRRVARRTCGSSSALAARRT